MDRSHLLTHWTGRDIEPHPSKLNKAKRLKYLERLISTLEHGFWMPEGREKLTGRYSDKRTITSKIVRPKTCFTELRLSRSASHARRYGLLGFVVDRLFVLDRMGAPVHYVRSNREDGVTGNLINLLAQVGERMPEPAKQPCMDAAFFNASFLKRMSSERDEDFCYLDENEWRIVQTERMVKAGRITRTGHACPPYKIPIQPGDLKLLVLPDGRTRDQVVIDERFNAWRGGRHIPLLTVQETEHI